MATTTDAQAPTTAVSHAHVNMVVGVGQRTSSAESGPRARRGAVMFARVTRRTGGGPAAVLLPISSSMSPDSTAFTVAKPEGGGVNGTGKGGERRQGGGGVQGLVASSWGRPYVGCAHQSALHGSPPTIAGPTRTGHDDGVGCVTR